MASTVTSQTFPRPYGSQDPAIMLLYQQVSDRVTFDATPGNDLIQLSAAPMTGTLDLYKLGVRQDEGVDFTINSQGLITLPGAALVTDVFHARYYFRATNRA